MEAKYFPVQTCFLNLNDFAKVCKSNFTGKVCFRSITPNSFFTCLFIFLSFCNIKFQQAKVKMKFRVQSHTVCEIQEFFGDYLKDCCSDRIQECGIYEQKGTFQKNFGESNIFRKTFIFVISFYSFIFHILSLKKELLA